MTEPIQPKQKQLYRKINVV